MLNKAKLLQQLNHLSDALFIDRSHEYEIVRNMWQEIVADPTFVYKVRQVQAPWPVPDWQERLDAVVTVPKKVDNYHVLSVDGSQIYPDRHQPAPCYLINVGFVSMRYDGAPQPVFFDSVPYITSLHDAAYDGEISPQMVNCQRQEYELRDGAAFALRMQELSGTNPVMLFDGSLIFWHLEAQDMQLRDRFLPHYLAALHQLAQKKVLTASYISMPKSRELINLIRLHISNFEPENNEQFHLVDGMVDATIAGFYLEPYQRTIVFKNNAHVSSLYPDALHPHFFYVHVGDEIGRVEIPAWVAQDVALTDYVAAVVIDQCIKGNGYPVVLAEAHEQAVVKGPDRDFFYHVLHKMGIERKYRALHSMKAQRKRRMGI